MREQRQIRTAPSQFETREDGDLHIVGYFAVFNSDYEIAEGLSESIAEGAFDNTLGNDVRALINHDTTLVLGRTSANTLTLRVDDHGLWGDVTINPNDGDAMNLYARVKRGDVNQCSFGFYIVEEDTDVRADGSMHWTIKAVDLFEVSVCTFPAYEATSVEARTKQAQDIKARELDAWRTSMKQKLRKD